MSKQRSCKSYNIPTCNIREAIESLENQRPCFHLNTKIHILRDHNLRSEIHRLVFFQDDITSHPLDKAWAQCRINLSKALYERFEHFPSQENVFDFRVFATIENFEGEFVARRVTGMTTSNQKQFENKFWNILQKIREKLLLLSNGQPCILYNITINLVVTRELLNDEKRTYYVN